MTLSRRALVALSVLAVPALASCSGGDADAARDESADGGFHATITHLYGETVLEQKPTKIATVSWVNADTLLALGLVPAGMPVVTWGGNDNGSTDWIDAQPSRSSAPAGAPRTPPRRTTSPTGSTSTRSRRWCRTSSSPPTPGSPRRSTPS